MTAVLRAPSAWLPIALALTEMSLIVVFVARFGVVENTDEGAGARLFQVIVLAQAASIMYFALRWLPHQPKAAAVVLGIQLAALAIPIVTIVLLEG